MISYKESLVSSKISYNDFNKNELGRTIGELLKYSRSSLSKFLFGKNYIWHQDLESMKDWKIINFQPNTPSGFSAVAFQKPDGEIVIAFRGTEPDRGIFRLIKDLKTDAEILAALDDRLVRQFNDARQFVCRTMKVESLKDLPRNCKLSLTGHSLGGGIAQYIAYLSRDRKIEATTFNAVGIGQCLGVKGGSDGYPQIKNYCDSWDIIGNFGISVGERIYVQNDQRIDKPEIPRFHSPISYLFNPIHLLEDHWNYKTYQFNVTTDFLADQIKRNINTTLIWAPYSHGLEFFRNKCDEYGNFDKTYQATRSEVEIAQTVSKGIFYVKMGIKTVDSVVDKIITKFTDMKKAEEKTMGKNQSKPSSKESFSWPKWSTSSQKPRDFMVLSIQMRQNNLAKNLGYSDYGLLLKNSEYCGEKSGITYFITENPKTDKVVLWDNFHYTPIREFPNRKAWESAQLAEHLKNPLDRTPQKAAVYEKSGMTR